MGSDCWNGSFRATRKGILSVNNFFRLRLLFDRWVACANLLQCSTHSALASLNKKARVWKATFRAPKVFLAPHLFSLSGLGKQHVEPRACFAAALPFHLWAPGLESTKKLFEARKVFSSRGTFCHLQALFRAPKPKKARGLEKLFEPKVVFGAFPGELLLCRAGASCSEDSRAILQEKTFRAPKIFPFGPPASLLSLCSIPSASCCAVLAPLAPTARALSAKCS